MLAAAFALFTQSGFADVSMQQIADEAAITKATLYHHFQNKQDLYIETMRRATTRIHDFMRERISRASTLEETLTELLRSQQGSEKADMHRLASDFRRHVNPELQKQFWREFEKPWVYLEPPVENAMARGEIATGDAPLVARYLFAAAVGCSNVYRFDDPDTRPNDVELAQLVRMMLRGVSDPA